MRTVAMSPSFRSRSKRPVQTHFKMAEIHKGAHDDSLYQKELAEIVLTALPGLKGLAEPARSQAAGWSWRSNSIRLSRP